MVGIIRLRPRFVEAIRNEGVRDIAGRRDTASEG